MVVEFGRYQKEYGYAVVQGSALEHCQGSEVAENSYYFIQARLFKQVDFLQ